MLCIYMFAKLVHVYDKRSKSNVVGKSAEIQFFFQFQIRNPNNESFKKI